MKYKLLRFSLLSMLVMFFGGLAHADYKKVTSTSDLTSGDYLIVYEAGNVAFNGALETLDAVSNTVAVEISDGTIASSEDVDAAIFTIDTDKGTVASASGYYIGVSANSNGLKQTDEASTYTHTFSIDDDGNAVIKAVFDASTMTLRFNSASNQSRFRYYKNSGQQAIQLYKKVSGETPVDNRIETTLTLTFVENVHKTTGVVGEELELPGTTIKAGETVINVVPTWSSSNEEVAVYYEGKVLLKAAGTAKMTATYAGDDTYKGSSASYTLTVTAAPIDEAITSLKALQEAATSTSMAVTIQFNNVFVTAVKGSNAYLADADGYGVLVYQKDHGLEAGQVLNGTISANLVLYRGQTEITNFSTEGLTITTAELTPTEKTIDAITAANQSTLVTLKGVTYSDGKLSDGTNEITFYDTFSVGASLEDGATYDITGIVILYNTTIEIAPRTADDIVKTSGEQPVELLDLTLSFPQERYEATMGEDFEEPVLSGVPEGYDGMITYKSSDANVATVSYQGEVTLVAPGTVVITAEGLASQTYKYAEASYTLTVMAGETPVEPGELANPYTYTFESKTFDEAGTQTLANANWTLATDGGYFGYDGTKGQQIGSGSKPATTLTLTTADIPGTITKVTVNTSGAKDIDATFSISVGETAFEYTDVETTTSATLTNTATDYTFTGSASGAITLSWANSSSKAIYVKSIYVEYTNEEEEGYVYRDFAVQLTKTDIFDANTTNFGVKVAEDGTYTAVAADDKTANFTVNAVKLNDTQHGWVDCVFTIPVQGAVKIELGDCQYGGQNGTITDSEGNVTDIKANATKKCWSPNAPHENVVVAYYAGTSATTLSVTYKGYCPFIAVTSIDPSEIPSEATITFDVANAGAEGVAPAAQKVEIGATVTIPANTTLYKEGYTLTAWTDGTTEYAAGAEVTVSEDITLMPVFTENAVKFADRTEVTTLVWQFGEGNGAGTLNAQGKSTILITQATIGNNVIDVKMDIDATNGKINNVGRGDKWAQCNDGTVLTIPAYKGMTVSFDSYSDGTGTTIGGVEAADKAATYEGTAETLDIVAKGIDYIASLTTVYPVPTGEEPVAQDITGTWSYADAGVMEATMALSGSNEAGEVEAMEKNGLKMVVEANGASFRNNGDNIQVRSGAVFKIPVKNAGDLVTVVGYPGYSYYTIGNSTEVLNNENTYKAKISDAEAGYVAITSQNDNNYFKSLSVTQYAPKEKITLDNEAATVTFPFDEGTEGQKATFSNDDYFLNSKVVVGSNWFIKDKTTYEGTTETRLEPVAQHNSNLTDDDAVSFVFTPLPGFTFTPTKVSFKANRFGTDNGLIDAYWQNADGTTVELEKEIKPERNNSGVNTVKNYDIEGATPGEGSCGLKLFLYKLQASKQIGLADIVIEGTLSGTEKDVPILASFKVNGNEYAVEDVFGEAYEATLELPKAEQMVGPNNPLTDVTATSGEIGEITYEEKDNACTVTIPMTAGETAMDYVLNVVFKPDFTLSYLDVEGNVLATQAVEKDATIGRFAYDIANVSATKDGYKARGWFKQAVLGEKYTTDDVITSDVSLYAIQTEVEKSSTHKKYYFDLADKFFYAEDHEAFNPAGDGFYWHDAQHGWAFKNGNTVDLLVGPKATITVTLCQYGSGTGIAVKKDGETLATLAGIAEGDGGTAVYNYEGEAGTLTLEMQCGGEMYIHGVKIVNTAEVNFESQGNWYFVKAGDGGSLIDVIEFVNGKNASSDAERSFIFLPDGTYDLNTTVKTAISGHNISIIGQSMDKTVIVTAPDKSIEGLGKADLFDVSGTNLYMQDLTLQNALDYYNAGSAGRAAVLQDAGNRTIGKNVRMLSYQDTYYSSNSGQQAYWETCDIHGTVDFICGGGDIRFQNTTISLEPRALTGKGSRTITAPTTNTQFGYVFDGCKVVDLANGQGDWNFGRTWQNEPICVYLNTTLDENAAKTLVASRWTQKGMNNKDPKLFGEYGTKDVNGNDITPSSNKITSFGGTFETILTADQAAEYAYDKMFTDWAPARLTVQLEAPAASYNNGKVTWVPANDGAIAYALFKNGEFVGITTDSYMEIDAAADDILTIRAANACGGFGEANTVTTSATSIKDVETVENIANGDVYTLQGVRVDKARKGLYIINGKKVVVK